MVPRLRAVTRLVLALTALALALAILLPWLILLNLIQR